MTSCFDGDGRTDRASLQESYLCVRGFNGDYFNPRLTGCVAWDWADVDRFVAQLLFVLYGRACKLQTDTEYTGAQSTGGRRITFARSIY